MSETHIQKFKLTEDLKCVSVDDVTGASDRVKDEAPLKTFHCEVCSKQFTSARKKVAHMAFHAFICRMCDVTFKLMK